MSKTGVARQDIYTGFEFHDAVNKRQASSKQDNKDKQSTFYLDLWFLKSLFLRKRIDKALTGTGESLSIEQNLCIKRIFEDIFRQIAACLLELDLGRKENIDVINGGFKHILTVLDSDIDLLNQYDNTVQNFDHFINFLRLREKHIICEVKEYFVQQLFNQEMQKIFNKYQLPVQPASLVTDVIATARYLRNVMQIGKYKIGIGVGPEALPYVRLAEILGLKTANLFVDDIDPDRQTYYWLDPSEQIDNKLKEYQSVERILIIEDDVKTGATLERVKELVQKKEKIKNASFDLFLGLSPFYQDKKGLSRINQIFPNAVLAVNPNRRSVKEDEKEIIELLFQKLGKKNKLLR